jgi:glycosyltransferase involved in cell wall biosynthesis
MKILHTVEYYYPSKGGMQEVVKQLSERLVKYGHEVTVATSKLEKRMKGVINGVRVVEFNVAGNEVDGFCGEVDEYRRFLLESDYNILTNFAAQQWATDAAFSILGDIDAIKVFVPTGFSKLFSPRFEMYFRSMKFWMYEYDMNIFTSNAYRDIKFARDIGINKLTFIPNAAAEEEFLGKSTIDIRKGLDIPRNHFLILHVGSHTGMKGHAEAITMFHHLKLKNATLLIIGNPIDNGCQRLCKGKELRFRLSPKRLSDGKRLRIVSLSRDNTIAAFKEADVFLFPSWIECSPLVLFECLASKTPFLTTDVGNAREIIEWTEAGQLLPSIKKDDGTVRVDIEPSIDIIDEFCHNEKKRRAMAECGFKKWQKQFTWEKIARSYEDLYRRLCGGC